MKDKNEANVAVRIPYGLWLQLDRVRQSREAETNEKTSLSAILREAFENYVGDTWK